MTDVREITRKALTLESPVINASVTPSAKYSCRGSFERLANGNTAIERMRLGAASRARHFTATMTTTLMVRSEATANARLRQADGLVPVVTGDSCTSSWLKWVWDTSRLGTPLVSTAGSGGLVIG